MRADAQSQESLNTAEALLLSPNPATNTGSWAQLPPMRQERVHASACIIAAKPLAVGGAGGELPRCRWHLGCILLKMPAISLLAGMECEILVAGGLNESMVLRCTERLACTLRGAQDGNAATGLSWTEGAR